MFSGIVQTQLTIQQVSSNATGCRLQLSRPPFVCQLGDSILLNGICTTIAAQTDDTITVDYMPQTLRQTTVSHWQQGQTIHAEPAATASTTLSGWLVSGHIDTVGTIMAVTSGTEPGITVSFPNTFSSLVMPQGGLTIDGCNLTITTVSNHQATTQVTVQLIPYTIAHTHLAQLKVRDIVNLEFDYLAKLVARWLEQHQAA